MVNKSMEKLPKRWKSFPMLYFPKLFLREQMASPRVFGHHKNAMNFFNFCIQWPSIYRIITRYLITCSKCEWEDPLRYLSSFQSTQGEILGRSWGLVLNYITLEVVEAQPNS
jgi:hypothetical protein